MFSRKSFLARKILYQDFFTKNEILKEGFNFFKSFFFNKGGTPLSISLMLTSACNNNCQMCFEKKSRNEKGAHLKISDIRILIKNIANKKTIIFLTGGEPFLHPQIFEIIEIFKKNKNFLSICTNGTSLDEKGIDKLSKSSIDSVVFSMHGFREAHDQVTGQKGNFDKLIGNIKELRKRNKNIPILVNYTITPFNLHDMKRAVEICDKLKVDSIRFQHINFLTNQELKEHYKSLKEEHSINQFITNDLALDPSELIRRIKEIKKTNFKVPVFFMPDLKEKEIQDWYSNRFSTQRKCFFAFREVFVDCQGDVSPCRTIRYKLGNIRNDSLKNIFNSKRSKKFRRKIRKKLFPACSRCCRL